MPKQKPRVDPTGFLPVVLLALGVLQASCPSEVQPKECVQFFNESTDRLPDFRGYDLEKQLTIHRCGLDRHPPYDRSYEIAERGSNIIPTLMENLDRQDDETGYDADKSRYAIILIFVHLAARGDLANDKSVLDPIERAVSEIKTNWMRKESEESLKSIKAKMQTL